MQLHLTLNAMYELVLTLTPYTCNRKNIKAIPIKCELTLAVRNLSEVLLWRQKRQPREAVQSMYLAWIEAKREPVMSDKVIDVAKKWR